MAEKILGVLEVQDETSLSDLLDRLHRLGVVDDTSVKAVIWQLVAQGDIELTSQRALRVPLRYRPDFALGR
jgi:hypothetical protein